LGPRESGWTTAIGPHLSNEIYAAFRKQHAYRLYAAGYIRATQADGAITDAPFCEISEGVAGVHFLCPSSAP
jgi:hypothetical protein